MSVQVRSVQLRSCQDWSGQVAPHRSGQVRPKSSGQDTSVLVSKVRSGENNSGLVRIGQIRSDKVRSGEMRSGLASEVRVAMLCRRRYEA